MSKQLLAEVNAVESKLTFLIHLTIVVLEGFIALEVIACGTDDLALTFALRIPDNIDGEDVIIESSWHRKF
jgi:hypothetical protein